MCRRFNQLRLIPPPWITAAIADFDSSVDIQPGMQASVIVDDELVRKRWGLIPSWAKPDRLKQFTQTFNARAETITELKSFSGPIVNQRCLIPVNGVHESQKLQTGFSSRGICIQRTGRSY